MKHKLLTFAGALALLAVIGKFYALPAIAQTVRATLVKNIDERGRIPYQASVGCTGLATCTAFVNPVPANSRLVIEHIGVQGQVFSGVQIAYTALGASSGESNQLLSYDDVGAIFQGSFPGVDLYVISQPVLVYFEAGQIPGVQFAAGSDNVKIAGVISGYLVDLSQ
ncbi:MAG TPA: hypothetical protein VGZ73_28720 [Bryobacteraceae bacterium]|nr:hypothetical protein [Bryobacteraceae bacterium]